MNWAYFSDLILKKYMRNNKLVLIIIGIIFVSFSYLAYVEKGQADLNFQKNWYSVYFAEPKGENLSFTIENYSDKNNFHWEILKDKEKIQEENITISKGNLITIDSISSNNMRGKITITVFDGTDKQEIYKYLQ